SSLIVLENAQTGIIEDITIEHSALRTTGTNAHAVAINNQGIVRRVINQAEVIFNGTASSPETFITSVGPGVGINAGTVTSLLFTRPAAWRIDSATPTSFTDVSGNCQVTMNEMFMLSANWQSFITDSPSTFQLRHWDKRDYDLIAADFTNAQEPI